MVNKGRRHWNRVMLLEPKRIKMLTLLIHSREENPEIHFCKSFVARDDGLLKIADFSKV